MQPAAEHKQAGVHACAPRALPLFQLVMGCDGTLPKLVIWGIYAQVYATIGTKMRRVGTRELTLLQLGSRGAYSCTSSSCRVPSTLAPQREAAAAIQGGVVTL